MLNVYLPFGLEFWETALGVKPPKDKFEIVRHTTKDGEKLYLWHFRHPLFSCIG